jgi:hypothetical protein
LGVRFAFSWVCHNVEGHALSLIEAAPAGSLDGTDVNENIAGAVVRRNEAEALLVIEELYGTDCHGRPRDACVERLAPFDHIGQSKLASRYAG